MYTGSIFVAFKASLLPCNVTYCNFRFKRRKKEPAQTVDNTLMEVGDSDEGHIGYFGSMDGPISFSRVLPLDFTIGKFPMTG